MPADGRIINPVQSSSGRDSVKKAEPALSDRPFGFNVIGHVSANTGLGVAARSMIQLLLNKSYPIAVYDVDPGLGRHRHDNNFDQHIVGSIDELPYSINWVCLNINSITDFVLQQPSFFLGNHLNVALIFWELPILPRIWIETLECFDVVSALSEFLHSVLQTHLSNVFTIVGKCPLNLPHGIQGSREQFGLPEDVVLFVNSFDPYSDIPRKNPFAVIDAFQRAFPEGEAAHLVIKLNSQPSDGHFASSVEALEARCDVDPRIHVITQSLTYREVLTLYASCDVFVSLHRAEGLGLGLMEAMSLGKPVVATAWSGNMSFMDHTNSCLVGYKLIAANGIAPVYDKGFLGQEAMWADPDIAQAATWMRRLVDDRHFREKIGGKATEDLVLYQREANRGRFIEEIGALWEATRFMPSLAAERERKLQLLRDSVPVDRVNYLQRAVNEIRRQLDRHILWRFNAQNSDQSL